MKVFYLLSVIFLLISFMRLKKTNKKESVVSFLIYSIGLLYCYNIVIVFFNKFLHIKGSLFVFSIINVLVSLILSFITFKRKEKQKYYFKKEELYVVLVVALVCLLTGIYRFRGFTAIAYESVDSSIHFRAANYFSGSLNCLNKSNSSDIIYGSFNRMMPASYINGGLFMNICSFMKNYIAFIVYDTLSFILLSLMFVITIFKLFEKKKLNYLYVTVISLLYSLGFPLNNLIFGFCYLGLGVMIFNLLLYTVYSIEDFSKNKIYNIIIISILIFSVFHSYYLFMPPIYLSLGIYYIYLYKKKKITFKEMFIYGVVTLLLPFIHGFCHYILPSFIKKTGGNIFTYIKLDGYIYENRTPLVIFYFMFVYIFYKFYMKKEEKITYYNLNLLAITFYILLFEILLLLNLCKMYYFYKLFYLYFIFLMLTIYKLFINKDKTLYLLSLLIFLPVIYILIFPSTKLSENLKITNVYNWNSWTFNDSRIVFDEDEIRLMNESIKYKDVCLAKKQFLVYGLNFKNPWYYSITGFVPIDKYDKSGVSQMINKTIKFDSWNKSEDNSCLIYYYEGEDIDFNNSKYKVLYENKAGAILKR